ncbi:MAG: nuclease [Nitrospiraceae bacterium]|nr:nuclease [Nitrospiraceae bacterium]MSR24789.1 nuclease [Nitrospiraceae bacterium]
MNRPLIMGIASLLALIAGALPTGVPDAAADSIAFEAMVIDVQDGDTIIVLRNNTRLTVKLPGIDAPELDQPYGPEAKRFAAKLVKGRVVTIETTQPGNPIYDGVRFSKNRMLAHEMVKAGMAWTTSMDKSSMFGETQEEAKTARLGLWVNSEDEEPIPPWEWRAQKRPR